jgi:hypothetical protein
VKSPKDDMESLAYVLVYLLRGSLPWQSLQAKSDEELHSLTLERKRQAEEELFEGLPTEFKSFYKHVCHYFSERKLDYSYLRRTFRNLFHRKGFKYDFVFDWTELKFAQAVKEKEIGV